MSNLLGHESLVVAPYRLQPGSQVITFLVFDEAGSTIATFTEKPRTIGQRFWLARDWILSDQHSATLAEIAYRPNKRERATVRDERGEVVGRIIVAKGGRLRVAGMRLELQDASGDLVGVATVPGTTDVKKVTFGVFDSAGSVVGEITTKTRGGVEGAVLKNPVELKVTGNAGDLLRLMMLVLTTITWTLE